MVTNKRKDYTEQFTGYGNQCLYLWHPFLKVMLILLVQYAVFSYYIYRGKKQKLSQKWPSPLGYPPFSLMSAGT